MQGIAIAVISFLAGLLALSVRHCLLKRGQGVTFNFFFFLSLYVLRWVLKNLDDTPVFLKTARHFIFLENGAAQPPLLLVFAAHAGMFLLFVFLCYMGWCIAERVLAHLQPFGGRLFATVLVGALASAILLYPVEAMGNGAGLWEWRVPKAPYDVLLIRCPLHPLRECFFLSAYFLSAFFLICCSRFRDKGWKVVFFALPFIHLWTIRFFGEGTPRTIERGIALAVLAGFAFFSRLELKQAVIGGRTRWRNAERALFLSLAAMMCGICVIDIAVLRQPALALAALPALLFAFLPQAKAASKAKVSI